MIGSAGETEASFGGVQLARDSRPGVRRIIVGGGSVLPPSPFSDHSEHSPMPYKTQPSDDPSGFGTAIRSPIQAEPA